MEKSISDIRWSADMGEIPAAKQRWNNYAKFDSCLNSR